MMSALSPNVPGKPLSKIHDILDKCLGLYFWIVIFTESHQASVVTSSDIKITSPN